MAEGTIKKHPISAALLLTPARVIQRCDVCCEECLYAIRAEPCNQVLDEDCEPTLGPIWLCTTSRCFEDSNDIGSYKTGIVIKWGGICYETIPDSITLVSKLDPEIVEDLIDSQVLECIGGGCTNETACGEPDNVCACLCRSEDCCMSRLVDGQAPWSFTYSYVVEEFIKRTTFGAGMGGGFGCLSDDCDQELECVYFRTETEIDPDELAANYTPITEQGCEKTVPLRFRIAIRRLGANPVPPPSSFACCSVADDAPMTWSAAGEATVGPPSIVPYDEVVTVDTGELPDDNTPCYGRVRNRTITEGDCSFFQQQEINEVWSYSEAGDGNCCQQYARETRTLRIEYQPATDELTQRLCEQCARALA